MLKMVDLAGLEGVVSEFSPGVFLQVYLFPCGLPSWGMWLVFSKVTPYLGVECVQQQVVSLGRDTLFGSETLVLMFYPVGHIYAKS